MDRLVGCVRKNNACISFVVIFLNLKNSKKLFSQMKQKKPGILCKSDIDKAYDNANREYLLNILGRMAFGQNWIHWIKYYFSMGSFSVLISGGTNRFLQSTKGDLGKVILSPFLFLLATEGLSSMVKTTNTNG